MAIGCRRTRRRGRRRRERIVRRALHARAMTTRDRGRIRDRGCRPVVSSARYPSRASRPRARGPRWPWCPPTPRLRSALCRVPSPRRRRFRRVNRTDRLYALVEELRAHAPRAVSARRLADRFEVSVRTIERDVLALQEAGVPIYAEPGRTGGYAIDAARTLPPVNFTAEEATAIALALKRAESAPLAVAARGALTKIIAAMSDADAAAARDLGGRLLLFGSRTTPEPRRAEVVPRVVDQAIVERRVLRVGYRDKTGTTTRRSVEPVAVIGVGDHWYLSAWCRMRDGVRAFRLDRIEDAVLMREVAPPRELPPVQIDDLEAMAVF